MSKSKITHSVAYSGANACDNAADIEIYEVFDKAKHMDLLLLGDEQESMVNKYIDRGVMFAVAKRGSVIAEAVVTDEGGGIAEIKNIAVTPNEQRRGIGAMLIDHICRVCAKNFDVLQVGTGDGTPTVRFYEKCGFTVSHKIERFFTDNYDHPIYENGVRLTDMAYLRKRLR